MNTTTSAEIMSPVDHAWLEMDTRQNPMIMVGILELRSSRPSAEVARTLSERLLQHPRFSQIADNRVRPPVWRHHGAPDLSYHLRVHPHSAVRNQQGLAALIRSELALPLDHHRPLWRASLFRLRGGRLVVLVRAHHAIADGVAMMGLLRQLGDHAASTGPAPDTGHRVTLHDGPLGSLIHRLESLNSLLLGAGHFVAEELRHPDRLRAQIADGEELAVATAQVLRLPADNPALFTGTLSGRRQVAWTRPLPLEPLHDFAHARGATINDVFLAALAGVFRDEMRHRGETVDAGTTLRITIPVNLRTSKADVSGNRFGLVLLDLPVGQSNTDRCVRSIAERMQALKESPQARAVLLSLGIAGQLPAAAEHRLIDLVADKSIAVVSNLPGPEQPLSIGGATLENLTFFPPQAGHIGIGISLMGYAGHLTAGISADPVRVPDPHAFVQRLQRRLLAMRA